MESIQEQEAEVQGLSLSIKDFWVEKMRLANKLFNTFLIIQ